jgi:Glyoxalase-like domain
VSGPRLRQAVIAARDLELVAGRLREELGLGEPFSDPGVGHFGLRNAVFTLGDTFLEVVSPARPDTSAGRQLERHGGDCGYMLMFQVEDLPGARRRASSLGVREVFEVALPDMAEVHLHPADMRGAIVSLSSPRPPASWRWGGPDWAARSAALRVTGAAVGVRDPEAVGVRWRAVLGGLPGVDVVRDDSEAGLIEIRIAADGVPPDPVTIAGVRLVFESEEER